jgi:hypothetical protein
MFGTAKTDHESPVKAEATTATDTNVKPEDKGTDKDAKSAAAPTAAGDKKEVPEEEEFVAFEVYFIVTPEDHPLHKKHKQEIEDLKKKHDEEHDKAESGEKHEVRKTHKHEARRLKEQHKKEVEEKKSKK